MLAMGTGLAPARRADRRRAGDASFGDAARPLVPRYLRRGRHRAAAGRRQRADPARRGAGAPPAGRARPLQRRGRGDLPAQRLRQPRARGAAARARARDARRPPDLDLVGDVAAREGVRARVDDGGRRAHEADLRATTPSELDRELRRARLHGRAQLRRLRRDAAALAGGARAAVPDRGRRAGGRDGLVHAAGRGARRQPS